MDYLGGINLFTSHFVIGCIEIETKANTLETKSLRNWINFKDSDWGMENYTTKRTQYISYPHIIELDVLSDVLLDLARIYKKEFPYSTKLNFIEHTFSYTLYDLERFVNRDFRFLMSPPEEKLYEFYTYYSDVDREYLDFGTDKDSSIENYKQYYKRVISFINEFDYDNLVKESSVKNDITEETSQIDELDYINNFRKEDFKLIEAVLFERGYLNSEKKWSKKASDITRLFNFLKANNFIKINNLISEKGEIKRIFNLLAKRYSFNLAVKNLEASRMKLYQDYNSHMPFLKSTLDSNNQDNKPTSYNFSR